MKDLYLKFASESAARAVLYKVVGAVQADPERGIEAKPGKEVLAYRNVDFVGTLYEPTCEKQTVGGIEVPVMAQLDGWHVNVRLCDDEDEAPLAPYAVTPTTPSRVWA